MISQRHFASILFGLLLSLGVTRTHAQDSAADPWTKEIDALVAGDAANPPPQQGVVFVGSSSIRLWATLAQDFPGAPVINRGFGGSRITDSTRNAGRLVVQYHPKLVVLYAGDNDIAEGRTADQVVADFEAFVDRVHRDLPRVPIIFISIKPSVARFTLWPKMRAANEGIANWAKTQNSVAFVDVATKMLDAEGRPRPELLLPDGLHMQRAGYLIWIDALTVFVNRYRHKLH
jgi:lysophospholipase L1-like esterase